MSAQRLLGVSVAMLLAQNTYALDYQYDALHRLVLVNYTDGSALRYRYDAGGNLLQVERFNVAQARYEVSGYVFDSEGNPLAGVEVKVGDYRIQSDAQGYYAITAIAAGEYPITAILADYQFEPLTLAITADSPITLTQDIYAQAASDDDATGEEDETTDEDEANEDDETSGDDETNEDDETSEEGETTTPSLACVIYAVHDANRSDSQLFTIDAADDFLVKLLGQTHDQHDIEALDIHPVSNEIFAAAGDDGIAAGALYQVDAADGRLSEIGATGFKEINGLSFHPNGELWGWAEGDGLIQIDPQTGQGTLVNAYAGAVEDLTWDTQGVMLYAVEGKQLLAYNTTTETLSELNCRLPGGRVEALEMLPDGRLLFSIHGDANLNIHALQVDTCEVAEVSISTQVEGAVLDDVEGIAYPNGEACAR